MTPRTDLPTLSLEHSLSAAERYWAIASHSRRREVAFRHENLTSQLVYTNSNILSLNTEHAYNGIENVATNSAWERVQKERTRGYLKDSTRGFLPPRWKRTL